MALPFMSLWAVGLWGATLAAHIELWPSLALFAVAVYLMVELNNRNALMRRYSRMVSCAYIALMMMCPWLVTDPEIMGVQLCVIAALSLLFTTYQQREAVGRKYWAYLMIGVASVVWPPVLVLLPLLWIGEAAFLMSFSGRAFFASLLGVVTPWWLAVPTVVYLDMWPRLVEHVTASVPDAASLAAFTFTPALPLPPMEIAAVGFVAVLTVTGIVHFFRQSFHDNIHVRMLYQLLTLLAVAALVLAVAVAALPWPTLPAARHMEALLVATASPLVAHFVTFSTTRLTGIVFFVMLALVAVFTVLNFLPFLWTL